MAFLNLTLPEVNIVWVSCLPLVRDGALQFRDMLGRSWVQHKEGSCSPLELGIGNSAAVPASCTHKEQISVKPMVISPRQ